MTDVGWIEESSCGNCNETIDVVYELTPKGPVFKFYDSNGTEIFMCPACATPLKYEDLT
jgi:uncharacterized protein with PIN domain